MDILLKVKVTTVQKFFPHSSMICKEGTLSLSSRKALLCRASQQEAENPRDITIYPHLFVISKGKSRVQPQSLRWDLKSLWKCCGKESRNNDGARTALANSFMIVRIFSRQDVKTNLILRSWQPIAAYFQLGSTSMSYRVVFLTMWCVRVNWTPSPV